MKMPSDFGSQELDEESNKKRSSLLLPLFLLAVGLLVLAFYIFMPPLESLTKGAATQNQAEFEEEILPAPPREEFDFYNVLTDEQPQLFDRKQPIAVEEQQLSYSLVVEYFLSYHQALSRSQDLARLRLEPIKIEPYVREGEIRFRLRLGPYSSRSQTNAMRDILYDNDVPHRLIAKHQN